MKFVKENILDYIKRIVEANHADTQSRRITTVELSVSEWSELEATVAVPRHQPSIKLAVCGGQMRHVVGSCAARPVNYNEVEIKLVRTATCEDF
ncbi:hypothetical protein F2P58_23315 [Vibrio fortis]|uniref:Uncharacterized protein n=1 Tax=Vibrio fortis TaxID=212667 RepID=A0A5N3QTC8_9VIBR|nr:hypothetical protein [Vibrio fortis]KAB0285447.1 hypothetical protein F2P58_23315 [Vibrio fortis]